ncbi:MAG: tricarballylate utilization 4Fe-4S protein TcuB [Granulosicoccus sp.]
MQNNNYDEAVRQLTVCNSCRYCEGYCNAFQALTRYRSFDKPTVSHLANLCHNCRGCYYACQYTEPHEFALNIPALLADIRAKNWEQHVKPTAISNIMQISIWPYVALTAIFTVLLRLVSQTGWSSSEAFYMSISHTTLVSIFLPLFILPWVSLSLGVRSYWASVGGSKPALSDLKTAFSSAATMKNLAGGQGQGCNYESTERYTHMRRWAHHATMYGFLLCFASTSVATVMHYVFNMPAPYSFISLPKLLGVSGGLLLSYGTFMLALLKWKSDASLGSVSRTSGEYAFIGLLFLVSTTGLVLYWSSGTSFATGWLVFHLALVATFFVSIPYSKMVHGIFRLAALSREAQIQRLTG